MSDQLPKIHPELQPAAKRIPKFNFGPQNVWLLRAAMWWLLRPPPLPDVRVSNVFIPGLTPTDKIRLRLYQPQAISTPAPALLWLHGGGYVLGAPEQDDLVCAAYVRALGLTVVSVDYACAPQHPFPAALEQSYAALKWMAAQAAQLNVDPKRLAIGGASAGGGLAAALAQLAHDRQAVQPVLQLLIYPMLDDRTVLRADLNANQYLVWTPASNRFGWAAYLGQPIGAQAPPPYAVPARRQDLAGLPPAWLGVGTLDLFYEEDLAYAQQLNAQGVACELHTVPGAFHGFDTLAPQAPIVQNFQKSQIAALQKYLSIKKSV